MNQPEPTQRRSAKRSSRQRKHGPFRTVLVHTVEAAPDSGARDSGFRCASEFSGPDYLNNDDSVASSREGVVPLPTLSHQCL